MCYDKAGSSLHKAVHGFADFSLRSCIYTWSRLVQNKNRRIAEKYSGNRKKLLLTGRTDIISNICFRLSSRADANSAIPKGTYAVGYVHGNCENTDSIYRELLSYIEKNDRRITGNAYEEYLIDELSEVEPSKFVMKILIRIE